MQLTITRPDYSSPEWENLSHELRLDVRRWMDVLGEAPECGVTRWLHGVGETLGVSYATARAKYYALRNSKGDWKVLIDNRKTALSTPIDGTSSPAFRAALVSTVESYQRNNAAAFRALKRRWLARKSAIPGYETWPEWPAIPVGWHARNLARIVKEETNSARLQSIRVGTSSKTNIFLPTVRTTRVGLWPGAVLQLDDVWHDNMVTLGKGRNLEVVRVLELGALDLFSAHRFHWGAKPRRRRENGTWETIAGKDMRLFTAGMFHRNGYSPRGTMLMSEHNTAKISEDVARILYDASHGMIRVDYQPIEGKQAALNGFWSGTEGGNFRAKAALESLHNLIHNDLAALAMQTGSPSSGLKGPVTTDRIVSYIARTMKSVLEKAPHRAELLQLPTLDFHTQFIPFLMDYYQFGLAMRTDHDLEGWAELGHEITEYTLAPGSGQWLSQEAFLKLPDTSKSIISSAVRSDPQAWTQRRKLSPLEVWKQRDTFQPLPPVAFCDMLGDDLAREVKAARGFLEFHDEDIAPDALIYQSRFISGPQQGREIPHGETVKMFALPFDDSTALVVDAKGRFMGEVPLYKKVCPINPDAFQTDAPFDRRPEIRSEDLRNAAGEKHSRIADMLEPTRINQAHQVTEARDLREHNKRVISGAPITPEEIDAARHEAAAKAASTRRVNEWSSDLSEAEITAAANSLHDPCTDDAPPEISSEDIATWLED